MGAPWFNRQDQVDDVIESGIYQVKIGSAVTLGYPVEDDGSIVPVNMPPYSRYKAVKNYTDVTSVTRCLGVAEESIPASLAHPSLRNIEWRHLRRDVAVAKHAVRMMKNMDDVDVLDTAKVAPYPGGFVHWETGMAELGTLKRGPCAPAELGMIAIDVKFVQT